MTTDELRAKFEAFFSDCNLRRLNMRSDCYEDARIALLWEGWQAAYDSRDAEAEALRKDAKRWRAVRSCVGNVGVYEGTPTYDPGVELLLDEEADQAIDAAMQEVE